MNDHQQHQKQLPAQAYTGLIQHMVACSGRRPGYRSDTDTPDNSQLSAWPVWLLWSSSLQWAAVEANVTSVSIKAATWGVWQAGAASAPGALHFQRTASCFRVKR